MFCPGEYAEGCMTVETSTKDGREILTLVPKNTKDKMMEVSWDPMKPWKDACTAYYKGENFT